LPQYLRAYGGQLTDAQRNELQQRLLDSEISRLAVTQHARNLGYRVTDAQVLKAYQSEPAFQVDGKFDPQAARARLLAAGFTEAGYEADLRSSLLTNQLAEPLLHRL
jgi:peptidyl-prolyl cis-trans isomerase D